MKNITNLKLTKNQKYAVYFLGAVVGTYIVIEIIKSIGKNAKPKNNIITQTIYTDKYLSGLPLDVDNLNWASKVPAKYLPSFDAIGLAKSDSVFNAKAKRIQTLLNQRMEALFDGYPALTTDGLIGGETTKSMIKIANYYGKLNDLVPLKSKEDLDKWATFFGVKAETTNNDPNTSLPWWNLK
jgi:hypothetical protein